MIVSCPGCSTHYTHSDADAPQIGRCSRCDETFALTTPKRRYRVLPATPVGPSDPLLAAALSQTETLVDRPAPGPAFVPPPPAAEEDGFFGPSLDDDEALFGIDETSAEAEAEAPAESEEETPTRRPAHPIREALGVFLLAGLGGAAGFQGSLQFGFDPLMAVAVGLGLGLTFGWAWIRWAERKR